MQKHEGDCGETPVSVRAAAGRFKEKSKTAIPTTGEKFRMHIHDMGRPAKENARRAAKPYISVRGAVPRSRSALTRNAPNTFRGEEGNAEERRSGGKGRKDRKDRKDQRRGEENPREK